MFAAIFPALDDVSFVAGLQVLPARPGQSQKEAQETGSAVTVLRHAAVVESDTRNLPGRMVTNK